MELRQSGRLSRRTFLSATGATLVASAQTPKKRVAAIVTEYREQSHADVIIGRLLDGYAPNGRPVEPRSQIVSMFTDQIAVEDMSRPLSRKHGFPIFPTIREAMTLGGDDLAVDAVLFVGEHGRYPFNRRGQKLYPRHRIIKRIAEVFRETGKSVPVFCDKHLSYSWRQAKQMYDWSRELGFPVMAGSSIPVTTREPPLEIPLDSELENALVVGYGQFDAYGFHTLESLQCMVERRRGGETGIRAVEWIEGDDVWQWRDSPQGQWTRPLLQRAFATNPTTKPGRPEDNAREPAVFRLEYNDGFSAVAYMLSGHAAGWTFAGKLKERLEPVSTYFGAAARHAPHFDGLVHCIEEMFVTGKPLYPVERTLLTTGALALLFESRAQRKPVATPELAVRYRAPNNAYFLGA